jgi:hypothetical protein
MPGVWVIYGTVRARCPLETVQAAAPGAELQAVEAGEAGWERLLVRWSDLSVSLSRMGPEDERFAAQVQGLSGLTIQLSGTSLGPRGTGILSKAAHARHVVGVAVEPAEDPARTDALVRAVAMALNGLVLREAQVLDSELRVLLTAEGEADPEAAVPTLPSAMERKRRIMERMEKAGIGAPPDLPALEGEEEAVLRDPAEVARRAQALFAVAVKAAGVVERKEAVDLLQKRGLWDAASPEEQEFLLEEEPADEDLVRFRWRRESLAVLLWALGHLKDLPAPVLPCELEGLIGVMRRSPAAEFVEKAELGPLSAILDAADLTYRCHGLVAQALLAGEDPPGGLLVGVVRERHAALFWLLGYMNLGWDDLAR